MQRDMSREELRSRMELIEQMVSQGRRSTESWGWIFVLWGAAYFIAFVWAAVGHSIWAWPATMSAAGIVTAIYASRRRGGEPATTLSRSIGSLWAATAISMFVLFFALGFSGRLTDAHIFLAVVAGMLGMANGASAILLRWKVQFACALAWWATAALVCCTGQATSIAVFLVATFFCDITFGIYCLFAQAQARGRRNPMHA